MTSEIVTTPERSQLMSRVRQKDTSLEKAVKKILESLDLKFECNVKDLPGSPDFVNLENKWAIFAHGCYWHAHAGCNKWRIPKQNRNFWETKFRKNTERDIRKIKEIKELEYSVLVIWECELERKDKLNTRIKKFLSIPYETYEFTTTKKSVVRTVYLRSGKEIKTRILLKSLDLLDLDSRSAFDLGYLRKKTPPYESRHLKDLVRSVDLFSGCGGLSLGAREACRAIGKKFVSISAIDDDPISMNVYRRNFQCSSILNRKIGEYIDGKIGHEPTRREKYFLAGKLPIDLMLAGPPCQGYSDLNNHTRRDDPRNALYQRVTRFVEIAKPDHVLVENVPSVVHGKNREVNEAFNVMKEIGYNVDRGVINLAEIGVPQKRKRHVLVASLSKKITIDKIIEKYTLDQERSVSWAISDLEGIKPFSIFDTPTKHTKENVERIRYLHENNVYDLPDELRPICHQDGKHSYTSMYGRMELNKPAQTITSGYGSPGQGRYIHPKRPTTITPHEAARLQFFPDFFDYSSVTKRTKLAEMIGNAVPMKLSYIFCIEFLA